jgi:tRNA-2-methylthio-N6-dimethylallyladenosine synthase
MGCQMNKSDGERVANYLDSYGYLEEEDVYKADLVVLLTCGVRYSAESRIYGLIPNIKKKNPKVKIVLSGCLVVREDIKKSMGKLIDYWLPIVDLPGFYNMLQGEEIKKFNSSDYLKQEAKYKSSYSAFVPIGNGCNNFCSYCFVPYARGPEVYRSVDEILEEVKNLIKNNYKEITLIAQNVNSYKFANINFPKLLQKVNDLEGDFWLRFATSHPKDMSDELIEIMPKCSKLCHHVHVAVQSGDNKILKAMNRKYTREHFINLIKKIRKSLNKKIINKKDEIFEAPVSITTDVIVGFPGETKKQFLNTAKLFKKFDFDMAYISRFSPRPMTAAEKMDDNVSRGEKREREEYLMKILQKTGLKKNKKYINKIVEVLVDGKKEKTAKYFGHTKTGKGIRFKSKNYLKSGSIVKIKIKKAEDFRLEGDLVNKKP